MGETIGPGPSYSLPPTIGYEKHDVRKYRNPQYSFGSRFGITNKSGTPGPNLNVQNLTRYGRARIFAYSLGGRLFTKDAKTDSPGPANYDLNKVRCASTPCPPSYSFGERSVIKEKANSPGPSAYGIKDNYVKPSAPSYSIGLRTTLKEKAGSPGPANYYPGKMDVILPAAPQYSMTPRQKNGFKSIGPGAAHYNRMYYRPGKNTPSYSFGIRHSPKSPPMIIPCDNM